MKLRDSFISIQHISNELNVPLTTPDSDTKTTDIFPSDYEMSEKEKLKSPQHQQQNHQDTIIADNNIKIIDKATKASGTRVRNLKKSMLNDNKLIRLRNKLLRRSKSSVGLSMKKDNADYHVDGTSGGDSKEEYQNKENELPKQNANIEQMHLAQQTQNTKIMSPNRNRVKMGTRVFSSQFLNKSFDNIYDNAMNVYHFDDEFDNDVIQQKSISNHSRRKNSSNSHLRNSSKSSSTTAKKRINIDNFDGGCTTDSSNNGKSSGHTYFGSTGDGDRLSLKSTSLSSLYFSEKLSEKYSDSPLPSEAYVIRKY